MFCVFNKHVALYLVCACLLTGPDYLLNKIFPEASRVR